MKPAGSAGPLLALLVLVPPSLPSSARGDDGDPADPAPALRWPAGRTVHYHGSASVTQRSGGEMLLDASFDCRALLVTREHAAGSEVLVFRSRDPGVAGQPVEAVLRRHLALRARQSAAPVRREWPQELDAAQRLADVYFPLDLVALAASPAAAGERHEAESVVRALGQVDVTARLTLERTLDGSRETRVRALPAGAEPAFSFNENPAALTGWRERVVIDRQRGLVIEHAHESTVRLGAGEAAIVVEVKSRVAEKAEDGAAEGAGKLDAALAAFAAIEEEVARRSIEAAATKIDALARETAGTATGIVAHAAATHLRAYREFFDGSAAATILARALGSPLPDVSFEDLEGNQVNLREAARGKVALVNFWGVACGPCRQEAPHLEALHRKYADQGFLILAINDWKETREKVAGFVKDAGLTYKVLIGGAPFSAEHFAVTRSPTGFWVDHHGTVIRRETVGFHRTILRDMEERLQRLLAVRNAAKEPAGEQ